MTLLSLPFDHKTPQYFNHNFIPKTSPVLIFELYLNCPVYCGWCCEFSEYNLCQNRLISSPRTYPKTSETRAIWSSTALTSCRLTTHTYWIQNGPSVRFWGKIYWLGAMQGPVPMAKSKTSCYLDCTFMEGYRYSMAYFRISIKLTWMRTRPNMNGCNFH